ncbi:MAG: two-component system chemotaxis sensor kinase CheA [Bradymonadia bacterium]|jgi:two-component system chemotaxis sensor kinase CheA
MDTELLQEFLIEGHDSWQALDEALLALEEDTDDMSHCNAAFRGVHNIKGAAGFMEATALESVSHAAENVLDLIRSQKLTPGPETFSALFQASDKIHDLLGALATGETVEPDEALVARLRALATPGPATAASATEIPIASGALDATAQKTPAIASSDERARQVQQPTPHGDGQAPRFENPTSAAPLANVITFGPPILRESAGPKPNTEPRPNTEPKPNMGGPAAVTTGAAPNEGAERVPTPAAALSHPIATQTSPMRQRISEARKSVAAPLPVSLQEETTVRVDVALLDDVMNLVGELVVCRNQILRVPDERIDDELGPSVRRLNHLTSHIQERVMKTRMQPIGSAWSRLPRVVRDLASSCGKDCELRLSGEHVELDRSILAQIKDPLVHMVRNAVDHGLEQPEERELAGKPRKGVVHLSAAHVGGQVLIALRDDGRGLDAVAILEKAVERGLITVSQAQSMPLEKVHQLIFEPGFSTAQNVSKLSGRGVGLDVVRSNLKRLGGTVDVTSTEGEGSTIKLKIPLTLAILPALIVRCSDQSFAIPQAHLVELIDLEFGTNHTIESVGGVPVLRRRGELLPLVVVDDVLGLDDTKGKREFVVVVHADEASYGLYVDSVEEVEEIVVKPLGPELESVEVFSGATVRGDGSITLILDVVRLGRMVSSPSPPPKVEAETSQAPVRSLLRFRVAHEGVAAIDVCSVIRIEDVSPSTLETHSGEHFMVWQDSIVPVTDLAGIASLSDEPIPVVVCAFDDATVAIAVLEVIDVLSASLDISEGIGPTWASGMALVEGKSTSLLDLRLLRAA